MNLQFKMDNNLSPPATSSKIWVICSIVFLYTSKLSFSALINSSYCLSSSSKALFILLTPPLLEYLMESIIASIFSACPFKVVSSLYQTVLIVLSEEQLLTSMQ